MSADDFSIVCISQKGQGTLNNTKTYTFNFTSRPRGKYAVSFSFISRTNDLSPTNFSLLTANFNSASETFEANSLNLNTQSYVLGILKPVNFSSVEGFFSSTPQDNPTVILDRPSTANGSFTLTVVDLEGTIYIDNALNDLADYCCILHFHKI